jgi:hypothetical protein
MRSHPFLRSAAILAAIAVGASCASMAGSTTASAAVAEPDFIAAWNAIPQAELRKAWDDAQRTGGVLAVEPDAHGVGAQAGQKKTWDFADRVLKLVWGNAPNWFPADLVRRTTCGTDPRWSYFWHALSGEERDLHPWIDRVSAFGHLLGPSYAASLVTSKALDLGSCTEVQGEPNPCLYGEVTPPEPFEQWFCGGPAKGPCRARLSANPRNVPAEFARPAQLCFEGPWVMERVHDWRPEIHPAELVWTRMEADRPIWRFAMIPDDSGRFDKTKHFAPLARASAQPWSRDRAVEVWIAFASEPAQPIVFDLALRRLRKRPEPTRTAALTPPPPDADRFVVLPHTLGDVTAAVRSWPEAGCRCTRGFLVLKTRYRKSDREAMLVGLNGRRPDAPPAPAPFAVSAALARASEERAPFVEPSVRVLAFTRVEPRSVGATFVVDALARFDPRRAVLPEDERLADRSNEALRGDDAKREAQFGTRRPFRLEWTLEAFRESSGARVPIVVPGQGRVAEGTDQAEVSVVPFRGKVTAEVTVNAAPPPSVERGVADVVSLGQLLVTLPAGVVLKGTGRVRYIAPNDLGVGNPAATVTFRVPAATYTSEWDLVRDVLNEVDPATAAERVRSLGADACSPLPAGCTIEAFSDAAGRQIADPATRWGTLRHLQEPPRAMARFVRLFARALVWDRRTDDDERERLKRLLAAAFTPVDSPPVR